MPDVRIVRATEDDVAEMARRRCANEHDRSLYLHLADIAPAGALVAKDEGTPIGIAIEHALEDESYISELYVEPSYRGNGIGARLLAHTLEDAGSVVRSTLVTGNDVGSLAAVTHFGLSPQTPLLELAGEIPRADDLLRLAESELRFGVQAIDVARHGYALDALDREVRGTSRRADHAFFSHNATGTAFFLEAEFVGYAYAWPSGRIGPVAAASASYGDRFLAFALASLVQTYGASWCTALIPGANMRVLRAAHRSNIHIRSTWTFASERMSADFSRYVAYHPLLA